MKTRLLTLALGTSMALLTACGGGTSDKAGKSTTLPSADPALVKLVPHDIRSAGVVKGASSFTTPPLYTFADDGKTPSGVLVQLVDNAAALLGLKVSWSQIPYAGIVPALNSGKADLSGSQFSSTAANLQAANILSIYKNTVGLSVLAKNKGTYGDLTGACGKTFAVIRGSSIEAPALAKIDAACRSAGRPAARSAAYAGAADAYTAVRSGRVDGFLDSLAPANEVTERTKGVFAVAFAGRFDVYDSGFAIAKRRPDLAKAFAAAFDASLKNGSYQKIMARWKMPQVLYASKAQLNVEEK
ncbi:transporter substrate-binding domain-containing protein [Actinomadura physcomitrii]|uniref:transporter substrate-binding domain-containing protein n=1 Tax=Actinomadura physcomitrii TaxID=2650748 RepID=UPI001367AE12|nr:transporter substrate-binding domain-containing protein [Actinomadura physcomitrii]